jgi:hypothetical protein
MTVPSPTAGKFLISLLKHSSVDVICIKAAVVFVQANLHFEWKLQLFINVVSFHFVECCKKIEKNYIQFRSHNETFHMRCQDNEQFL